MEEVKFAIKCAEKGATSGADKESGGGIAKYISHAMNKKYRQNWDCIVGDADKHALFPRMIKDTSIVFQLEDIRYYLFQHNLGDKPKQR